MKMTTFEFAVPGAILRGCSWIPEQPRCRLLIVHGMADHCRRYGDFAAFLATKGVEVHAYDQRGHGATAGEPGSPEFSETYGFFADERGWDRIVDDLAAVLDYLKDQVDNGTRARLPFFLMGHSMGSFVVRSLLGGSAGGLDMRNGVGPKDMVIETGGQKNKGNGNKKKVEHRFGDLIEGLAGVILSGTGGDPGPKGGIGILLARLLVTLWGPRSRSPFMNQLIFGTYNAMVVGKKGRTDFDWISRDEATVDAYILDPACGGVFSTSFYRDLLVGVSSLYKSGYAERFPKWLPVLMFSGTRDPVGDFAKGVRRLHDTYKSWGVQDLEVRFFEDGRHEMLNEINRAEVYDMVKEWLEKKVML